MNIKQLVIIALLLVIACPGFLLADDTDLYLDPNSAYGAEPLVMFNLDYGSNFGSTVGGCTSPSTCPQTEYFRREGAPDSVKTYMQKVIDNGKYLFRDQLIMVMMEVFEDPDLTKVRAGIMLSHDDANLNKCPECSNGAYFLRGFQPLYEQTSREEFLTKLEALPEAGGRFNHPFQGKEAYFELFRYLNGGAVHNGLKSYNDFADRGYLENRGYDERNGIDYDEIKMDTRILHPNTKTYNSPLSVQCSKIFMINIMFQNVQSDDESDTEILAEMSGIRPTRNKLTFEDVVKYMRSTDLDENLNGSQSVVSYFITKNVNTTTRGYATAGGTTAPFPLADDDPAQLVDSMTRIFKEILSVSTTFVSASVPVNVFNRSESLDNVFIALFQAETTPTWPGNLKKLKIHTDTVTITDPETNETRQEFQAYMIDANEDPAVAADGRIRYDALTYWTDANALPEPEEDSMAVAHKDGRVVNRGGAGQKIPGFLDGTGPGLTNSDGKRKLFYDPETVTNNDSLKLLQSLNVDTTAIEDLTDDLDADAENPAEELLKYARGFDPDTGEMRNWLLADPLHSRPLPINYGNISNPGEPTDDPDIYIAMAAQDGFMHFFRNSDQTGDNAGTDDGEEVWGFMPRAVMDKLKIFRRNSGENRHPYTVDGAPAVFLHDENLDGTIREADGDRAVLYFGLRRGGKAYYALDVTDPEDPALLWRITKQGDFSELGQTWSTPRVGKVHLNGNDTPVVVFAGGYDANKDRRVGDPAGYNGVGTDDAEGNAIYVVNALSGQLIWKADANGSGNATHAKLTDSIPSDVTLVDTDGNGYSDRILVGDTGGKVWRVDIAGETSNWKITLLAELGSDSTRSEDRRFFHAPDIVQSRDGNGKFDAVIIGSGDRPNPLDRPRGSTVVNNWAFMIKDTNIDPNTNDSVTDLHRTIDQLKDADDCLASPCSSTDLQYGWKLKLEQGTGEKSLSTPLTIDNTVYFTTYLPLGLHTDNVSTNDEPMTCGPAEGKGLLYAVNLADAAPKLNYNEYNDGDDADNPHQDASDRFRELDSHGIPADVVSVNIDGQTMVVDPGLGLNPAGRKSRWRTFWYNVEDFDY